MKRLARKWLKGAAITLLLMGAISTFVWLHYFHRSIRNATEAQIRAAVPANLLPSITPNPAAIDRFNRLCDICKKIHLEPSQTALRKIDEATELSNNESLLKEAISLIDAGPLQAPEVEFPMWSSVMVLAKELALKSAVEGRSGHSAQCEQTLEQSLHYADAARHAGGAMTGFEVCLGIDSIVDRSVADCIRSNWLKPAQLLKLMGAIRAFGPDGQELKVAYRQELSKMCFGRVTGLRSLANELEKSNPPQGDVGGNFDVLATASMFANVFAEKIDNVDRPWSARVDTQANLVVDLVKSLPKNPEPLFTDSDFDSKPEPSLLEKLKYQAAMNTIPNSCAIELFQDFEEPDDLQLAMSSASRCRTEMLRALAAVWFYKVVHNGAYPSNLDQLTQLSYLDKIPTDWFSGKPILYNPQAHTIYSVGESLKDGWGAFVNDSSFPKGNFGFTEKPSFAQPRRK